MLPAQVVVISVFAFAIPHVICDDEDDPEGRVRSTKVIFLSFRWFAVSVVM